MKKILIVIDMQNDFIDGALGTPEAAAIVENVKAKIRSYPKENVFATRDTHTDFYLDTQEGRNLPVPHCIRGTQGWEIRPDVAELIFPRSFSRWQTVFLRTFISSRADSFRIVPPA